MGPIEKELRNGECSRSWVFGPRCSIDGYIELRLAALRLGFDGIDDASDHNAIPDIFSEAIEAAEALGL